MAAPVCCLGLRPLVLSWSRELPCVWRALHTSAVCAKNRAARVRVGKGDKPVTYEQAHAPHHIAHRKGWLSLHTEVPGTPSVAREAWMAGGTGARPRCWKACTGEASPQPACRVLSHTSFSRTLVCQARAGRRGMAGP
ncbi:small ribosomal subunit protein uS3m isoform 11-T14 [Megaptera novaeangliae]